MRIPRNTLIWRFWSYMQQSVDKILGFLPISAFKPARPAPRQGGDAPPTRLRPTVHGDERTFRRIAEAERGGVSSKESAARYARGENPGGMHHKAVRHGPEHQRPGLYEPQERKETVPGGERHIAVMRRGA